MNTNNMPDKIRDRHWRLIDTKNHERIVKPTTENIINTDTSPNWVTFAKIIGAANAPIVLLDNYGKNTPSEEKEANLITQQGTRYTNQKSFVPNNKNNLGKYKNSVINIHLKDTTAIDSYFNLFYFDAIWSRPGKQYKFLKDITSGEEGNILLDRGLNIQKTITDERYGKGWMLGDETAINNGTWPSNRLIQFNRMLFPTIATRLYYDNSVRGGPYNTIGKYYYNYSKLTHLDKTFETETNLLPPLTTYIETNNGIRLQYLNHRHLPFCYLKGDIVFRHNTIYSNSRKPLKIGYIAYGNDIEHLGKLFNPELFNWDGRQNIYRSPKIHLTKDLYYLDSINNNIRPDYWQNSDTFLPPENISGVNIKRNYKVPYLPRNAYIGFDNRNFESERSNAEPYFGLLNARNSNNNDKQNMIVVNNEYPGVKVDFGESKYSEERRVVLFKLGNMANFSSGINYPILNADTSGSTTPQTGWGFLDNFLNITSEDGGHFRANTESMSDKAKIVNLPMNYVDEYNLYYFKMRELPFFAYDERYKNPGRTLIHSNNTIVKNFTDPDPRVNSRRIFVVKNNYPTVNGSYVITIDYNGTPLRLYPGDCVYPESIYHITLRADYPLEASSNDDNLPNIFRKPVTHPRLGYNDYYYYTETKDPTRMRWCPEGHEFIPLIPINEGKITGTHTEGDVLAYRNGKYYLIPSNTEIKVVGEFYALTNPDSILTQDKYIVNIYKGSNIYKRLARYHFPLRAKYEERFITHDNRLNRVRLNIKNKENNLIVYDLELIDIFNTPIDSLSCYYTNHPFEIVRKTNGEIDYTKIKIINGFLIDMLRSSTYIPAKEGGVIVDLPIDLEKYILENFPDYTPSESYSVASRNATSTEARLVSYRRYNYEEDVYFTTISDVKNSDGRSFRVVKDFYYTPPLPGRESHHYHLLNRLPSNAIYDNRKRRWIDNNGIILSESSDYIDFVKYCKADIVNGVSDRGDGTLNTYRDNVVKLNFRYGFALRVDDLTDNDLNNNLKVRYRSVTTVNGVDEFDSGEEIVMTYNSRVSKRYDRGRLPEADDRYIEGFPFYNYYKSYCNMTSTGTVKGGLIGYFRNIDITTVDNMDKLVKEFKVELMYNDRVVQTITREDFLYVVNSRKGLVYCTDGTRIDNYPQYELETRVAASQKQRIDDVVRT